MFNAGLNDSSVILKDADGHALMAHKMYDMKIMEGNNILPGSIEAICSGWTNTTVLTSLKANLKKMASDTNPWLNFYISFSPAESIVDTDCPICVLYGEKDIQVRPELNILKRNESNRKRQLRTKSSIPTCPNRSDIGI